MSTTLVVITSKKNNVAITKTGDGTVISFNGEAKIDLHKRDEKDDEIIKNMIECESLEERFQKNLNYLENLFPSIRNLEKVVIKFEYPDDNADTTEEDSLIMTDRYNNTFLTFGNPVISEEDFFEKNYKPGGMCPFGEMKAHPEWKNEYADRIETKKVHMCKSCKQKWAKDCCKDYSRENRVMWKMVIGWHEN
jgi:hypothetical protein